MAAKTFFWVPDWQSRLDARGWWHSFDLPDGRHIEGVHAVDSLQRRLAQFPVPEDLRGARVLDIGAWDGWYTFEMERRGAEVVAIDCWDNPRFHQMKALMNSRAEYRLVDVYDLTPETAGRFDIVLFMGVFYHLKHPLLALEKVCAVTKDMAMVDSFILKEGYRPKEDVEKRPVMEFYEAEEFGGQADNWCAPSLSCLTAMCRTAGFARAEHRATLELGACVTCYRKWTPEAAKKPAPELLDIFHHTDFGINFQSRRDEYISMTFRTAENRLTLDDVRPEVGGYGTRPIHLSRTEDAAWKAKFKLPPGLPPGWHEVTLRVGGSAPSNAKRIALDLDPGGGAVSIEGAQDGSTWEPNVLKIERGNVLSVWVSGLAENADRANVRVTLGGERLPVLFVEPEAGNTTRQLNVSVPDEAPPGDFELTVNQSSPAAIRIER